MSLVLLKREVSWLRFMAKLWLEDNSRDPLTVEELNSMFFDKFKKKVSNQALINAVQGKSHEDVDRAAVPDWPIAHCTNRLLTRDEVAWLRRYCYRLVHIEERKPLPMKKFAMAFYLQKFSKEGQPARPKQAPYVSGQSLKAAILGETYKDCGALWMCLEKWPHKSRTDR